MSEIVANEGLVLAGWEDGVMWNASMPYSRSALPNHEVYAYAWNNIWEWGGGSRAYVLANNDYKVCGNVNYDASSNPTQGLL